MRPGEIRCADGQVSLHQGRRRAALAVSNASDYPVVVGSHYHFFEVNPRLRFDRDQAFGMHLDIPAGTCLRFWPRQTREVTLVAYGGAGAVYGCWGVTRGPATPERLPQARSRAVAAGLIREDETL